VYWLKYSVVILYVFLFSELHRCQNYGEGYVKKIGLLPQGLIIISLVKRNMLCERERCVFEKYSSFNNRYSFLTNKIGRFTRLSVFTDVVLNFRKTLGISQSLTALFLNDLRSL
jgi:hypothetical protein